MTAEVDAEFFAHAMREARQGLAEGGLPIGAALTVGGQLRATGRNQRVQQGSGVMHAEIDCLGNAGRLRASDFRQSCLYVTLSPCLMCTGAVLQFGIPRLVVGYEVNFEERKELLLAANVDIVIVNDASCWQLIEQFSLANKEIWEEDIGVDAAG